MCNYKKHKKNISDKLPTILTAILLLISINSFGFNKIEALDSIENIFKEAKSDSARVYSLVQLSQSYSSYDLKSSIWVAKEAIKVAEKSKNEDLISFAIFNAGNAFFEHGLYENATGCFYDYLAIQKNKGNISGEAYALSNIGAIHLKMHNHNEAKKCFYDALKLLEETKKKRPEQKNIDIQTPNILNNLGIVYQIMGDYDSALFYFNKAYRSVKKDGSQYYMQSGTLNNMGSLFLATNKLDSAYESLNKALDIRILNNNLVGQASTLMILSDYHLRTNQHKLAIKNLYTGLSIADRINSIDIKNRVSKKLFKYYDTEKHADSALKYYILFNETKDSINRSETLKELTRLKLISEFEEKEKIEKLIQRRKNIIYLFTSISLVLLLGIFALLFFLSKNRVKRLNLEKNNIVLESKNIALAKKNLENELELKNKELTTNVMSLIRKNELIKQTIEILSARKNEKNLNNESFISSVINDLNNIQDESIWNEFEIRYQQVHNDFFEKLQKINPSLTTNERRLCAFLRLSMTTKDIASITGQTTRSIEVARTRLRKKLNLTNMETSLIEFLSSL